MNEQRNLEYKPAVDVSRLLAAILIVCFHAPNSPYRIFTISGLAYFIVLTFCLQAYGKSSSRPYSLRNRATRLLGPWLMWSLFYALITIYLSKSTFELMDLFIDPRVLLIGPRIHLWFLPFAFVGSIVCHFLLLILKRLPMRCGILALGVLSTLFAAIPLVFRISLSAPFEQWMYAAPLIPIALAIGLYQELPDPQKLFLCYLTIITITVAWLCAQPSYLVGVLVVSISLYKKTRDLYFLRYLASLTMGIYLIHPAAFLIVYKLHPGASWQLFAAYGFVVAAFASATITFVPRLRSIAFG